MASTSNCVKSSKFEQNLCLSQASETICRFVVQQVQQFSPERALRRFKHLFIEPTELVNSEPHQGVNEKKVGEKSQQTRRRETHQTRRMEMPPKISLTPHQALAQIATSGSEETFINTFKRSIYILINNWNLVRQLQYIQELVHLISTNLDNQQDAPSQLDILKLWRSKFMASQDYQELVTLALRTNDHQSRNWSQHYNYYSLVYQSVDQRQSVKQKTIAKTRSLVLKKQFELQLAMYTARSTVTDKQQGNSPNPTKIGHKVLHLIKRILQKRGAFNYTNLARIFLKQAQGICYKNFKYNLLNYLFYSLDDQDLDQTIKKQLSQQLEKLYESYDEGYWNNHLLLRTCNRLIEYLTTVNQANPSSLFMLLITQGKDLTLAIMLLKLVLLCPRSRTHLECCLAQLIEHYQSQSAADCQWLINFLEVLQVTLSVYAEDVQYNLVNMSEAQPEIGTNFEGNPYRIFSQLKVRSTCSSASLS